MKKQPVQFIRQSLELTAEQWEMMLNLAAATNSCPKGGTTANQPSWRTLIKRLADGEFLLVPSALALAETETLATEEA